MPELLYVVAGLLVLKLLKDYHNDARAPSGFKRKPKVEQDEDIDDVPLDRRKR